MFFNALSNRSPNTGVQILEHKLNVILGEKIEKYIKRTGTLPYLSQMNKYTRKFSVEKAEKILFNTNKFILKYLLEYRMITAKIKVAFDIYKQLFYGKRDNPYIFGILAEKGTKKAYKWQTCAIILKGFELQVGSQMMQKDGKKEPFIKKNA